MVNGEYSLFMDFLTNNLDNSKYIIYGNIKRDKAESIYFIGLVENEKDYSIKLNIIVPLNVYDYKTEFVEFKKLNNWY